MLFWKGGRSKSRNDWEPTNLANIGHQNEDFKPGFKEKKDFFN